MTYTTDQKRVEAGLKYDGGKLPLELVPPSLTKAVAEVLGYGAEKYEPHNWRKGFSWSRSFGAIQRHLTAWFLGETNDPETGFNHLAHAVCGLAFLIEWAETHPENDDRWSRTEPFEPEPTDEQADATEAELRGWSAKFGPVAPIAAELFGDFGHHAIQSDPTRPYDPPPNRPFAATRWPLDPKGDVN